MTTASKRVPSIWTTGWTDVLNTGTWRNAIAVHQKRPAPCHCACPIEGEIPVWVRQVHEEDLQGAWQTLIENNPLPATIGRTCHHPCEQKCNRGEYDGAVAINALEQYVGDTAIREGWALVPPAAERPQKVAVIGGGPAGLSCAYQLRRQGYRVTIFDANPELGGVLRYGVPEYRLPKGVLAKEVRRIVDLGVEVHASRSISADDLSTLEQQFAALFIAFGAPQPKRLPQLPKKDRRVLDGIGFLRSIRTGVPLSLGHRVVVIGGGSVAMDVAGSVLRLGRQARILSLEGRAVMPASEEEIVDVLDEGALLCDAAMVKGVEASRDALRLRCVKVDLDPGAPPGVLRPLEIVGSDFSLDAETVILAVGQEPTLADWKSCLRVNQSLVVIDDNYMTSRRGVFAAGDVSSAERFVSTAIGDGKRAANAIACYLGKDDEPSLAAGGGAPHVDFADINTFYFPSLERAERHKIPSRSRAADFREIKRGLAAKEAQPQAERCFSCGSCVECDNCFYFCPDMAIVKDSGSPTHYGVLDQYCKGCGCCLEECPRGAMGVREETK